MISLLLSLLWLLSVGLSFKIRIPLVAYAFLLNFQQTKTFIDDSLPWQPQELKAFHHHCSKLLREQKPIVHFYCQSTLYMKYKEVFLSNESGNIRVMLIIWSRSSQDNKSTIDYLWIICVGNISTLKFLKMHAQNWEN